MGGIQEFYEIVTLADAQWEYFYKRFNKVVDIGLELVGGCELGSVGGGKTIK